MSVTLIVLGLNFQAVYIILLEQLIRGPTELAIEWSRRKRKAEVLLQVVASVVGFPRSCVGKNEDGLWVSDGSMLPAAVGITEPKTVIGAATGPSTLALRVPGLNASILHGELAWSCLKDPLKCMSLSTPCPSLNFSTLYGSYRTTS